jgi:hypothetical protein
MPARHASRSTAIRTGLAGLILASALGLTGCAGVGAAASPPDSSMDEGASHSEGEHVGMSDDAMAGQEPSAAAAMICSTEIRDAVAAVLSLPEPVAGEDSYQHGHYVCRYPLEGGPLELSVHEAADAAGAQAYADSIRAGYGMTEDIEGLANLGFPAYRSTEGAVVFVKDGMVLVVDAREVTVPGRSDGSDGSGAPSRADAAYQIATNVLACWKEHH